MSSGWMMIADMLASILTPYDVAVGTVFGPCDTQDISLADSVAFIALRCTDKRLTAFTHQVDTSVPTVSAEGPVWLRLVRSARNAEEQNMEAYVKDGRLFYRALKNIPKMAELLVWYGKELFELLGLRCAQKSDKGHRCSYCRHRFVFEFPMVAHQSFLCNERSFRFSSSKSNSSKMQKSKPAMDFHNLARNLENNIGPLRDSGKGNVAKRRHSVDSESDERDEDDNPPFKRLCAPLVKRRHSSGSSKICMSNEVGRSLHLATRCHANRNASLENPDSKANKYPVGTHSVSHIRRLEIANSASDQEEKSAFIQPPRSISQITNLAMTVRLIPGIVPVGNSATFPSILTQAVAAKATEPQASALFNRGLLKQTAFVYESGPLSWDPKPQVNPEWSLLPVALSPLGLLAQNWCAKCNVSFHMTSDLVQHMRSHHKRSAEQLRPHSQEKLRCPICDEGFRERHHLSRHMSSHTKSNLAQRE